eukprot:scaffold8690_cov221-Alexandrium_tamarense.AAC.1
MMISRGACEVQWCLWVASLSWITIWDSMAGMNYESRHGRKALSFGHAERECVVTGRRRRVVTRSAPSSGHAERDCVVWNAVVRMTARLFRGVVSRVVHLS